jgi:hypothetical protein
VIPARRGGFALVAALILVVLLGALIAGAFVATTEETRVSASSSLGERGLHAAESAVEGGIGGWVPSQSDSLAIGGRAARTSTDGKISVTTTLIRLDPTLYWLVAEARVGDESGGAAPTIRRRIGVILRRVSDSAGQTAILRLEERRWSELF